MNKGLAVVGAFAGIILLTASGCGSAVDDREGGGGKKPDQTRDATNVTVFRNADSVPNVALFCVGPYRFASTLSGGDDGANKAAALVRLSEDDAACERPQ